MPKARANGVDIEYETFGNQQSPALLLITGLGVQLLVWDSRFCRKIADAGFHVIRFDNRDTGLSTKCDGSDMEQLNRKMFNLFMGKDESIPYTIEDMADDAAGLLEFLNIKKAHVCGMSMGGFIAQTMAIKYPDLVLSLTSIYSHPGSNGAFQPAKEAMEAMLLPAPADRSGYIRHMTQFFKLVNGNGLPFNEKLHIELTSKSYDRSFYPDGVVRQYLAILAQRDRNPDLHKINIPSLVIHGDEDLLVPLSGGEATATAIPGAKLKIIRGMGHAVPDYGTSWWSEIADAIIEQMKKV